MYAFSGFFALPVLKPEHCGLPDVPALCVAGLLAPMSLIIQDKRAFQIFQLPAHLQCREIKESTNKCLCSPQINFNGNIS